MPGMHAGRLRARVLLLLSQLFLADHFDQYQQTYMGSLAVNPGARVCFHIWAAYACGIYACEKLSVVVIRQDIFRRISRLWFIDRHNVKLSLVESEDTITQKLERSRFTIL